MGFDPSQVRLPAQMLAVDLAQIGYEEGVFVAHLADIVIDGLNTALQSLADQRFCRFSAMTDGIANIAIRRLESLIRKLIYIGGSQGRRCHSQKKSFLGGLVD